MKYKLIMSIGALIMLHTIACTEIIVGRSKSNRWQAVKKTLSSSTAKKVYGILGVVGLITGIVCGRSYRIYRTAGQDLKKWVLENDAYYYNRAFDSSEVLKPYELYGEVNIYCENNKYRRGYTYFFSTYDHCDSDALKRFKRFCRDARITSFFDPKFSVSGDFTNNVIISYNSNKNY